MKRIRLGVGNKALVVVASLAAGASTIVGCIPDPDISGLPPLDASLGGDSNSFVPVDSGSEGAINEEAGDDDGSTGDGADSHLTGTITGVVINYSQGAGHGVLAGATVTVLNGPSVTTDAFGAFTLPGVSAGPRVQINVSSPTNKTLGVAYSTTQIVVALGDNQLVTVFPVLHQGCYETMTSGTAGSVTLSDVGLKCGDLQPSVADVWASLQYGATSFTTPSNGALFNGTARVEIVPIAFPLNLEGTLDFTWGLGLPGTNTPLDTIGATEFRVVDDATGEPLVVTTGDTSVIATMTTWKLANTTTYAPYAYSPTAGTWGAAAAGTTLANAEFTTHGNETQINTVDLQHVQQLGWLSVTSAGQATTCVTGALTANGAPAAGVWVHATGLNYLGAASAVTDSTGSFCVDVKAAAGADAGDAGATPELGLAAGFATTSGAFFTLPTSPSLVSSLAGGTCATKSGCTVLGAIALTPFDTTCVNGTASDNDFVDGGTFGVELVNLLLSTAQQRDGMETKAYIGTTTLADGGAFCAQATPGQVELYEPASPSCASSPITVGAGGTATTCGGGGCSAGGAVTVECP
jgi:hypothetical protein